MRASRIAVAGTGYAGLAHIAVARRSSTCTLAAVVDPAPSAAGAAAEAGVPLYRSLTELLEHDPPDGVIVATPNRLHAEHALECIGAGVPLLLEKPVAPTLAEAEAIVRAADEADSSVLIGHHRAHSPIMARARQAVEDGTLGRVVAVTGSATFFKPDHYFSDAPWRCEPGGGPILLNLIHEVHSLRMLCGEIAAVQAFTSNAVRGFAVEDTAAIGLRFASGALGTFILSDTAASARSWEHTSGENSAYPAYADEDCYVIAGTRGSLSVPTMRLKTYPGDEARSWWKPFDVGSLSFEHDDPFRLQLEHFGAVVRGEVAPLVTVRDGLRNLRVTEAISAAAASGGTVELRAD
jgi:predicted dehydrogenase